jgi:tripartite-type tricarboxylate transporter receptor subunit TctC
MRTTTRGAIVAAALAAMCSTALGADYPERNVTMVVAFPPGGPTDIVGRLAAKAIEEKGGKPVIVENRPGAGGIIGLEVGAKAAPDGYTFVLGTSNMVLFPYVVKDYKGNLSQRLIPVSLVANTPYIFFVHTKIPANSMRELVDYVRANPGRLNYGVASAGGLPLMHQFLNKKYGLQMTEVMYQGTAQLTPAAIRGDFILLVGLASSWATTVQQGHLKAIGVVAPKRHPLFPNAATFAEQGIRDFDGVAGSWFGVMAPAGTPRTIVDTASKWIADYVRSSAGREQIAKLGFDAEGSTPQEFAAFYAADEKRWTEIVKETGYVPQ